MSKFQIILLTVFGLFIVIGVATFSLYRGGANQTVTVTIWGDLPANYVNLVFADIVNKSDQKLKIEYVEKSTDTLDEEFTEALALSKGPDLILITQDILWRERMKFTKIPYSSITERDFKSTFIEEGELFLDTDGIYALPVLVDPMVLYYNRDTLSSAGRAQPIKFWDEIFDEAKDLSKRDAAGNLISSTMALGESRNIPNAKDIISLLLLQTGSSITAKSQTIGLSSVILNRLTQVKSAGESAFEFYTQFSNPTKVFYSWNRSLPDAQTHFTSGDSAYYVGFASEYSAIKNKNPNLNLGIAPIPQSRVSTRATTFGRIRALAISRGSRNPSAALNAALLIIGRDSALAISNAIGLPPTRRDILSDRPSNEFLSVFYEGALQSKGWLDPDQEATDGFFRDTIESITSGRSRIFEALSKLNTDMDKVAK